MKFLKKIYCKIFAHVFYRASFDFEKANNQDLVKCKNCNTFFKFKEAYGKWI